MRLLVSTPIPLIGSRLFEELKTNEKVRKEYEGDFDRDDSFDYQKLIELQTRYRTSITHQEVLDSVAKTRALVGEGSVAGFGLFKK